MRSLGPRSILDVGVGFGKWGHLFREYTDIIAAEVDHPRYARENWQVRIDGIEGYSPYLTVMHRYLYDSIYEGDATRVLPTLDTYDVVFMGDVIEHLDKREGSRLLECAIGKARRCVLVTTPELEAEQGAACGNELERHRSHWSLEDFQAYPGAAVLRVAPAILVAVVPARDASPIRLPEDEVPTPWPERLARRLQSGLRRLGAHGPARD